MAERIFIGVAWPYTNGSLHLGHIAGAYLPADIFARYHRLKGDEVLMVSGSDQHGTPVTISAEREGKKPQQIANQYHQEFLHCWQKLGISFDLFTSTGTQNHAQVVRDFVLALHDKGYIYKGTMSLPYCSQCQRFLPDRYVEGTCPHCLFPAARGDLCEECGKLLNPSDLLAIRCSLCGSSPQFRDSEHLFFSLSSLAEQLSSWLKGQAQWRPNVINFSNHYLSEGLRDRAITRDIEWGIPVPFPDFAGKRIYVWFEAVIGYLSASKEWAQNIGDSERWHEFWQGDAKAYYFLGKDNIVFHTIIWPAMLMAYGGLNLPYDVPANEFLTLEGRQFSTSRRWAVWLPDFLERYEPDALRYMLSVSMPEGGDTDFSWREFLRRNNDELVATYGNLSHRVLTFIQRNFDGCVPSPGELNARDNSLLAQAQDALDAVGNLLSRCRFREAIRTAMSLAQECNRYLEEKAPWKTIERDRNACATSIYSSLAVISCLNTALYPFLPFSSERLHHLLGFVGKVEDSGWSFQVPPAGQRLEPPKPLFLKLDDAIVAEEQARLRSEFVSGFARSS
jgi:methionyl-tRNA synthetase